MLTRELQHQLTQEFSTIAQSRGLTVLEFGSLCLDIAAHSIAVGAPPTVSAHDIVSESNLTFEEGFARAYNSPEAETARLVQIIALEGDPS